MRLKRAWAFIDSDSGERSEFGIAYNTRFVFPLALFHMSIYMCTKSRWMDGWMDGWMDSSCIALEECTCV